MESRLILALCFFLYMINCVFSQTTEHIQLTVLVPKGSSYLASFENVDDGLTSSVGSAVPDFATKILSKHIFGKDQQLKDAYNQAYIVTGNFSLKNFGCSLLSQTTTKFRERSINKPIKSIPTSTTEISIDQGDIYEYDDEEISCAEANKLRETEDEEEEEQEEEKDEENEDEGEEKEEEYEENEANEEEDEEKQEYEEKQKGKKKENCVEKIETPVLNFNSTILFEPSLGASKITSVLLGSESKIVLMQHLEPVEEQRELEPKRFYLPIVFFLFFCFILILLFHYLKERKSREKQLALLTGQIQELQKALIESEDRHQTLSAIQNQLTEQITISEQKVADLRRTMEVKQAESAINEIASVIQLDKKVKQLSVSLQIQSLCRRQLKFEVNRLRQEMHNREANFQNHFECNCENRDVSKAMSTEKKNNKNERRSHAEKSSGVRRDRKRQRQAPRNISSSRVVDPSSLPKLMDIVVMKRAHYDDSWIGK